jgi:hypothetical protein
MAGGASLEGADTEHLIAFGLVMGATSLQNRLDRLINFTIRLIN